MFQDLQFSGYDL